ncbi:peptidylprolyl isomerase [Loktanella sp. IMCC34160]|uniref:FKBP-type peptidyl-prolyl cis-trans isomerase n=1 Tax=Loktanella sp. IMCC34160 TaxID=2510646 RepID=UPI00101E10D1|nr:peptidylprolyl isomerase [Loktanella sp. IMCC34160]RYG90606.1 peptidylprolyl isomerase [Loktanella sp. IMCC34160]
MTQVKAGDTVRLHYTGTLKTGEVFDSSQGRDPLEFTVGSGQIIPGLDKAIPGMAVGDKKTVDVPCAEAYGEADPSARQAIPRAEIPDHIPTDPGTMLQMQAPNGQVVPVTVVEATETEVVLDANHRLAGQDLIFDIELVSFDAA